MGRCIRLSIILCLVLTLNISAKTIISGIQTTENLLILTDNLVTQTYTLVPVDWSTPTVNDTGDGICGMYQDWIPEYAEEAWVAFDLSDIPDDAQIISASLSAFMTSYGVQAQRTLWYYPDDSWAINTDRQLSDPGDKIVPAPDTLVGTVVHDESQYTWKTINITHNWSNDLADNYVTFMLTGPLNGSIIGGAVGLAVNQAFGIDKVPELTLTFMWNPPPIMVTSPDGGESWITGTIQTITWDSTGSAGPYVKIELYKNDLYLRDIISSTANDGEYAWPVPSDMEEGSAYKVKIIDTGNSSTYDYSDNYFNVTDLPAGTLQFKSSSYSVNENDGTIRIYVSRTGGSSGTASIDFATSDDTASSGSDYTQKSGTLYWANGDTEDKYFDVSITNDNAYEGNETFTVILSNASGASLESPGQATVFITDDDPSPYPVYPPVVVTVSSINITSSTATLVGILKNDGCAEAAENCICRFSLWREGEQGNTHSTDWQSEISQGQNFSTLISGLLPDKVYYFYTEAGNSAGVVNGNILSFKTYPDPNAPPAAFDPNEPNTLLIQNFVKIFLNDPNRPNRNQGLITYAEGIGLNGFDPNDVLYSAPASATESKIVSIIPRQTKQEQISGFYELSKDARPDAAQDSLLELSIFSSKPTDQNITSENSLKFWLEPNSFKGKTVTIQKLSSDANVVYPVWDINEIISRNGRQMPLCNLTSQKPNVSYAWFSLSSVRQILDLNGDGKIDLTDYSLLLADVGKTGIFRTDIACMKGSISAAGIPDGKVNETDVMVFITEYNKKNPANPIPNPYTEFSEDFESGELKEPFLTSGNSPWIINSDSYEGSFCAKSGDIGDNQNSILKVTAECGTGQVSFFVKVSSESGCDEVIFSIDGVVKGRWSGWLDWVKMTYIAAPGTHALKWEYKKDWITSDGADAAWIDNIVTK